MSPGVRVLTSVSPPVSQMQVVGGDGSPWTFPVSACCADVTPNRTHLDSQILDWTECRATNVGPDVVVKDRRWP